MVDGDLQLAWSTTPVTISRFRAVTRHPAAERYKPSDRKVLHQRMTFFQGVCRQYLQKLTGEDDRQFDEILEEPDDPRWADQRLGERYDNFLGSWRKTYASTICEIRAVLDEIDSTAEENVRNYLPYVNFSESFALYPQICGLRRDLQARSWFRREPQLHSYLTKLGHFNSDLIKLLRFIPAPKDSKPLDSSPPILTDKSTCEPIVASMTRTVPLVPPFMVPEATLVTLNSMERYLIEIDGKLPGRGVGVEFAHVSISDWSDSCGKSEIAMHYVHSRRSNFPGGIYWISAGELVRDIGSIVIELKKNFGFQVSESDTSNPEDLFKLWLEATEGWLVVLDRLRQDEGVNDAMLKTFVPQRCGGSLIVTSRAIPSPISSFTYNDKIVRVEMAREDAIDLFLKLSPPVRPHRLTQTEEDAAWEILQCFSATRLPLAILRAASYFQRLEMPLSEYAQAISNLTVVSSATTERTEDTDDSVLFVIKVGFKGGSEQEVRRTYEDFRTLDSDLSSGWYLPLLQATIGDVSLFPPGQKEVIEEANIYLAGLLSVPVVCVSLPLQEFLAGKQAPRNSKFFPREPIP
ncbi:MAG: hypothetical protein M1839_007189 [Geoglossum umbratile]|nr:MAG: hypothetical protein M1839_007189 [Geoglossum umbratile]